MPKSIEERLRNMEDVQAIAELKAAYCNAADGGWNRGTHDGAAVAALFVEDGVFATPDGASKGHAAIRERFDGLRQASPLAFHRITNPIIRVDGDSATGEWHLLAMISLSGRELFIGGIYNDEFVRAPRGWRFKTLHFTRAFTSVNPSGWKAHKAA
jgi:hypothetical protein